MIAMDMKERKLTVVGSVDPIDVVNKLRKFWHTDLLSVGPAKEPEKEEAKKEEAKKEEPKKEEPKKEEPKKDKPEKKKEEAKKEEISPQEQSYNPQMTTHYYVHSAEENPNACVIC
ncbi:hypothetical protein MA16_Dca013935 [Dendrobium catenatum]|uniref:HMA domain-containing protein n=1 Tax=Dendrobium catenatum TaxID=906689 RepID=A0A2I0XGF5_9ASPA|nr:hypothetical protein MA16_Dca013935 [Dendrobium catenatum]